jgi:type I restriction enzyme, S subunit
MSQLPCGWCLGTIADTGTYINGFAFKPEHWGDSGRPIIRIQNLTNEKREINRTTYLPGEEFVVKPGEILVSWSATLDVYIWNREEALLNQHIFRVLPEKSLLTEKYLFYLLKEAIRQMQRTEHLHGSTMKHINRGPFMAHAVPIAPLREQDKIVAEIEKQFTRLDDAAAALKRVQANLKRYRASVLKAACEGRLVPTEAEVACQEGRDYEPASELLKRILAERRAKWQAEQLQKMIAAGKPPKNDEWKRRYAEPSAYETSNLSDLPKGWTWTTVEQVSARVQYGSSAKCSDAGDIPVLRMGNLTADGRLVTDEVKYLPTQHVEFPELFLKKNDLLFNRTNSAELVGKTAVYIGNPAPCSFASYLIRVTLLEGCNPEYLSAVLNSVHGRAWIKLVVNQQVGQANVNGSKLQAFVFPLPPLAEQHRIVEQLSSACNASLRAEESARHELAKVERLRQSILAMAFSGMLVTQDPTDEPASVLLERIRARKPEQLVMDYDAMPKKPAASTKRPRSIPRIKKAGAP